MSYTPVSWTNTPTTPLNAENLNHMEGGIIANDDAIAESKNAFNALAAFPNQTYNLIKNHTDFLNTSGWNTVNTGTLTAESSLLKAVSESSLRIYATLEKSVSLNASASILVKIRARCVPGSTATVKPCWRAGSSGVVIDKSYIVAGNVNTSSDTTWTLGSSFSDLWFIAKDGTAQATIDRVGLLISSGATVEVAHFECYYSQDSGLTNSEIEGLVSDVFQNEVDIGNLQATVNGTKDSAGLNARMTTAEGNITALQATVNGSASTSGTIKNQIAAAKTEVVEESVNPLAERVTAAEGDITKLKNADNSLGQRIGVAETDITQLKSRATTAENNISANAKNISANATAISTNTSNITSNTAAIADLQAYVGYNNDDILGLQVDYANKTFTRLAGAVGKEAGEDFDSFAMYGGRRRCNVADDGTINAYYDDEGYTDDGSNGQVMVYQPAFYYKVVPLKLDKNTDSGIGYHIRKANYYVSATPHTGFKLHPAFYDENGNAVDYILYSAYEGSLYSNGHMVSDDSETTADWNLNTDVLCSIANVKPISGLYKQLTRANAETLAKNHGTGWHIDTIKSISANQLLMMIELGTMNTQSAVGLGVVNITDNLSYNCSSVTGATSALGNSTGQATQTINTINGNGTINTEPGKLSVSYRGIENPWGNIWKFVNGINIWGDGTMCGGQAYIADDFNFIESKQDGNYMPVGFTLPNANGYIKSMGYGGEKFDWLFLPSEIGETSMLPVGDYCNVVSNLNYYTNCLMGGNWGSVGSAGGFCCRYNTNVNLRHLGFGVRLLYIPTRI